MAKCATPCPACGKTGAQLIRRRDDELDFFCEEARVAIELDGSQHGYPDKLRADAERDEYLGTLNITVLRFWNARLRREPQVVRDGIFEELQKRAPHSLPDYTRPIDSAKRQP